MAKSEDTINLDDVLKQIGQFGRFQFKQYALMMMPFIFNALFTLNYVFTAGNLNYRCLIQGCDVSPNPAYLPTWLNDTVPFEDGVPAQCERYLPISNGGQSNCDADGFDQSTTVDCGGGGFIFEDEEVTIVRDFNITCPNNDWKLALVGTVNNIGQFVALPIAGYLSDYFGRRWVLLLSVAGSSVFGLVRSFSTGYEMFLTMEFLDPVIGSTMYTTAFILAMELVGPRMRVTGNNVVCGAFALGAALLGLLAMFFRDWRVLLRVVYVPGIVSLPLLWMTVESVRWLLATGRREKASKILEEAARMNGKSFSSADLDTHCRADDAEFNGEDEQKTSLFGVLKQAFKNTGMLLRLVTCSFCWMANVLVYYGLSLNSVSLAGNKYVNFILVSLIELPGILMMQLLLDRIGRKITVCSAMLFCGLFCFLSEFIQSDHYWPNLVLFMLSKMAATVSFNSLYVYTAEIFPTNLRQSLLSFCSMFGRIGSMIAPQTPLLAKLWSPLPMVVFGIVGIVAGLAVLQFPETLNTQLPNTVEEAMNLHKTVKKNKQ